MFVLPRKNILFRGPNGESFTLHKDIMGTVPAWVSGSAYFKALVADGKIVAVESTSDKAVVSAVEAVDSKAKKRKKE